ncbi:pollen-specific leucine-rich repeat extensin-like protein 2 [Lactuca sativa]|uniref:pollen-specific leucine-rich repeat extensin-like protein 2 n=1 Tax=Lactuca sativa TaxID=4236 RepID=UPI000CD7FA1B|nr:pollen-specific leucine-rich repeat extensin-like protein 2 [Lactuca sativa]
MADYLLSSITTFHATKIIVTDPTNYSFIGSIPEAMLSRISASSNVLQQYRKRPSSGPRELTPAMVCSIEEAYKPAKRSKKPDTQKEGPVIKPTKGQTPKKRKSDKAATSQHKNAPPSESESESSDEEASRRGDTPPRSHTPEIPVRSTPPSPPPVTIPVSIPPISPIPTTQPFTTIPIPTPIITDTTTTTNTTEPHFTIPNPPVTEPFVTTEPPPTSKPLSPTQSTETTPILGGEDLEFDSTYFSPYQVQNDDDDDEPVTKRHLKVVNEKLDQLLSSSSSGAYSQAALKALFSSVVTEHIATLSATAKAIEASTSQCQQATLAAAAAKNAQAVNASVENLQRSLQSERSNLEAARQAIEAANKTLHANVYDRLTQLEAELAVENRIMDELDRRTSQLKLQTHKLRTINVEVNDLKS